MSSSHTRLSMPWQVISTSRGLDFSSPPTIDPALTGNSGALA
ncbi:MAG: hypothetical protein WB624_16165 [Xanthobacteraceae bacterium]